MEAEEREGKEVMDMIKLEEILRHYSPEAQIVKSIEELAELQAELARLLIKQGDVKKTTSEIADVLIMVNQLTIILDITPEELENWIKFKIDRQLERIREQEQAGADCGWRKP